MQAKTDDGYFLGFPSLWNVVALYLYMLPLGGWVSLAVVVVLAILTFVPTRHLYPSQPGRLNRVATLLGIPWTFLFVWLIWRLPRDGQSALDATTRCVAWISLLYPVFYLGVSWVISVAHWRKRQRLSEPERAASSGQSLGFLGPAHVAGPRRRRRATEQRRRRQRTR